MRAVLLFICLNSFLAQTQLNEVFPSEHISLFKEIVFTLSDDSLHGRSAGSIDEKIALNYIEQKLQSITTKKVKFKRQQFQITLSEDSTRTATNGYFFLNNHAKSTILIGAHYDHIGYGDGKSTSFSDPQIHNGADDNASGVAIAMLLGACLSEVEDSGVNYLVVFYSGHELGLFGSEEFSAFILKKKRKFKNIVHVINLDMVGRMDRDVKILKCTKTSLSDSIVSQVDSQLYGIKINSGEEKQLGFLDTKSFYHKGISCLNYSTGIHLDYHKPSDDAKYINFEGMELISNYLFEIIRTISMSVHKSTLEE